MKKFVSLTSLLLLLLVVAACGSNTTSPPSNDAGSAESGAESSSESGAADNQASEQANTSATITYESERGPIEIPAHPQRIVALTNAPNVLAAGGTLVGVDQWTQANPLFTSRLDGVKVVSEADLEEILGLDPDLIIAGAHMEADALDKLDKIAPTIVFTWGKLDYLQQQLEIGKLLGKEAGAQAWIDDFTSRAAEIGQQVKSKHGEDVSVSVFETDSKSFSVFGANWARGTEILYQAMGLTMPDKAKADTGEGYYTLSLEVIPDYAGDFIVLSRPSSSDNSYMETEVWKSIPAVQQGHVIEIDTEASTYSDPISLEAMLDIFRQGMLGQE